MSSYMGYIEILMNEDLPTDQQLVIEANNLPVPTPDSANEYGPITIGGAPSSNFVVTMFNRFTTQKGYTICGYGSVLSAVGSQICADLGWGNFSLDPFTTDTYKCSSNVLDA
jgi:hypothetical protein